MKDIYDYIDAHADEFIADLQTFVQQPSISAQNIGLRECATLIRDMMHRDGLPAEFHELEEGPPVVYCEVPSKSDKHCCAIPTTTCSHPNRSRRGPMVAHGPARLLTACCMAAVRRITNPVFSRSTRPPKHFWPCGARCRSA